MKIQSIYDRAFKKYGKVLENYDFSEMTDLVKNQTFPENAVVYELSVAALEETKVAKELQKYVYGGLDIEIGYCSGGNHKLNGLEYHCGPEVNIACRNMILLLGSLQDVENDNTYDTSKVEAFLVPAGRGVQLYETTLHYAPCTCPGETTFCSICVLPGGTNMDLDFGTDKKGTNCLLAAKNKWLIAHEEAKIEGAFCGLKGENITIVM